MELCINNIQCPSMIEFPHLRQQSRLKGWGFNQDPSLSPPQVSLIQPGPIRTPIWNKGFESSNQIVDGMGPEANKLYGTLMDKVRGSCQKARGLPPKWKFLFSADEAASTRRRTVSLPMHHMHVHTARSPL